MDYGEGYSYRYINGVLNEPPVELKDKMYHVLVPKVDKDDNELAEFAIRQFLLHWELIQDGVFVKKAMVKVI